MNEMISGFVSFHSSPTTAADQQHFYIAWLHDLKTGLSSHGWGLKR